MIVLNLILYITLTIRKPYLKIHLIDKFQIVRLYADALIYNKYLLHVSSLKIGLNMSLILK